VTQVQEVLEMVEERVDPISLKIFDIYYDECSSDICSALIHVNPALPFHNLHIFRICWPGGVEVDLDDAGLLILASSCPQLRHLHLPTNPSRITATGLITLLDGCPELRHIRIQFTLSAAGFERPIRGLYPKLVSLEVGHSLVKNQTGGEAEFLEHLFPALSLVRYSEAVLDGH
jgi:hypothetical protein